MSPGWVWPHKTRVKGEMRVFVRDVVKVQGREIGTHASGEVASTFAAIIMYITPHH